MTRRYRLRTLLILLAILPPLLAVGWSRYTAWQADRERCEWIKEFQRQWDAGQIPANPPRGGIL